MGSAGSGGSNTGEPSSYVDLFVNEVWFYDGIDGQEIELYNGGTVTRFLEGFRIMLDDAEVSEPFGDVSIPPDGFLVLTRADFPFTLAGPGPKTLTLLDDVGATADVFVYPADSGLIGLAQCRSPDGGQSVSSCNYSMGQANY